MKVVRAVSSQGRKRKLHTAQRELEKGRFQNVALIRIGAVIHPKRPIIAGFTRKLPFLGLLYYTAF
jgi:hypothetical protein